MSGARSRRSRRRIWWILGPVGACPPGRRPLACEVFERYRYFRRDMLCVFDTEFGLGLAFAREVPVLIGRELAVRVVHRAIADPPA